MTERDGDLIQYGMTKTAAIRAVNELGFTPNIRGHQLPGSIGYFYATNGGSSGRFEITNRVNWRRDSATHQGYVIHEVTNHITDMVMTTPDEVVGGLAGLVPTGSQKEYVDLEQKLKSDCDHAHD